MASGRELGVWEGVQGVRVRGFGKRERPTGEKAKSLVVMSLLHLQLTLLSLGIH